MRGLRVFTIAAALLMAYPAFAAPWTPQPPMPAAASLTPAVCERVVDGDTAWFQVVEDGVPVTHKVRFLNIDTPETVHPDMPQQPGGKEASDYVTLAIEGKAVFLEYDERRTDRYGRRLCHVWLEDGTLLNLRLVRLGYASVLVIRPNVRYQAFFLAAQDAAQREGLGVWRLEAAR